jgi:hypothetical protein
VIESSHTSVLRHALTLACTNAALKVGFGAVEALQAGNGTIRVIASDESGRALVSEISTAANGNPHIETEVLGVTDGSCNDMLDAYDRALEEEGVRSGVPRRKFTGGVCELGAAREFIRRKVRRMPKQPAPAVKDNHADSRRQQKSNSARQLTQKR